MHALDVLGDPVRRRILEVLADGRPAAPEPSAIEPSAPAPRASELSAGEIGEVVQHEFGISQPAVSQHLRILREHGFATVRADGRRRLYAVDTRGPQEARDWLTPFERFWLPPLDALGTELARGRRQRRPAEPAAPTPAVTPATPTDPSAGAPPAVAPTPKET